MINIIPVTTQEQYKRLMDEALTDNHRPIYPTHLVVKDGEVTGSLSVLGIPVVTFWSHSKKMNARGTFDVINIAKNLGRAASGGKPVMTFCPQTSPIFQFLPKLGFRDVGTTNHFLEEES